MTLLDWVAEQLRTIRKDRLDSQHSKAQQYWRGYRDALRETRDAYNMVKKQGHICNYDNTCCNPVVPNPEN